MTHHILPMPITEAQVRALRVGDTVTLEETLYGIRDVTQIHMFDHGRRTKFNLQGHAVIHTAPNLRKVERVGNNHSGYEAVCVGTTTSDRIRDLGGAYLAVVGGAAALETTWIEAVEDVDMDDLNPESLYKFRIKGFGPLLVAMDSHGGSLFAKVNDEAARRRQAVLEKLGAA
ncbi:MAG: fumarate hydratase C-terminal domain-containing protein [Acetobacteraceae bacterium]|nr:fumarate hydratase C-terminal domain-containing protein [Acetobacteraceae bacterium]